jgi:hypothetical protein
MSVLSRLILAIENCRLTGPGGPSLYDKILMLVACGGSVVINRPAGSKSQIPTAVTLVILHSH